MGSALLCGNKRKSATWKLFYNENGKNSPNIVKASSRYSTRVAEKMDTQRPNESKMKLETWGKSKTVKRTKIEVKNGAIYKQYYVNDILADVEISFANGDVFQGEVEGAMMNGYGKITYQNGDIYKGIFSNNKKEGQGRYECWNGDWFDGFFEDDKFLKGVVYLKSLSLEARGEFNGSNNNKISLNENSMNLADSLFSCGHVNNFSFLSSVGLLV